MVAEVITKCGVALLLVAIIALCVGAPLFMIAPQAGTVVLYVALFAVCIGMPVALIGVIVLIENE